MADLRKNEPDTPPLETAKAVVHAASEGKGKREKRKEEIQDTRQEIGKGKAPDPSSLIPHPSA